MSTVRILDEQTAVEVPLDAVRRMAARILDHAGHEDKELSVVFTGDEGIRVLNRDFLGRDRPTNVVSVSQLESSSPDAPAFENRLLGDVVVSTQTCARNALEAGIEPLEEVIFCLIHGIAHLLGYDHEGDKSDGAQAMEEFELELFRKYSPIIFGKSRA